MQNRKRQGIVIMCVYVCVCMRVWGADWFHGPPTARQIGVFRSRLPPFPSAFHSRQHAGIKLCNSVRRRESGKEREREKESERERERNREHQTL